jgi:methionine-rich copper-binding protein CopC
MSRCDDVPEQRRRSAAARLRAAIGIVALVLLIALPAAPAAAHASLIDSDPPEGATLPAAPATATAGR